MKKNLLVLAYYFPPIGMSGTQRVAKFVKYLPEHGWNPVVLTVKPILYYARDASLLREVKASKIYRTESFDPQRLLYRIRSKYSRRSAGADGGASSSVHYLYRIFSFFFIPDTKALWRFHAMQAFDRLNREIGFDAIFSTSPPHSVQLLARQMAKKGNIPWVADFRDAWSDGVVVNEPTAVHRWLNRRLQALTVNAADAVIAVSNGIAAQLLLENDEKIYYIPNGFDPEDYPEKSKRTDQRFVFCHCGTISRFSHPDILLQAIRVLFRRRPDFKSKVLFRFVGYDALGNFSALVRHYGLDAAVEVLDYQNHKQALQYAVDADALVLIARGHENDRFIPGKTYEYIGSRTTIVAITDVNEVRTFLSAMPRTTVVSCQALSKIAETLANMVDKKGEQGAEDSIDLSIFNRRNQTAQLAAVLDNIVK